MCLHYWHIYRGVYNELLRSATEINEEGLNLQVAHIHLLFRQSACLHLINENNFIQGPKTKNVQIPTLLAYMRGS